MKAQGYTHRINARIHPAAKASGVPENVEGQLVLWERERARVLARALSLSRARRARALAAQRGAARRGAARCGAARRGAARRSAARDTHTPRTRGACSRATWTLRTGSRAR